MSDPVPISSSLVSARDLRVRELRGSRWLGAGLCALSAAGYSGLPILAKLAFAAGLSISGMLSVRFGGAAVLILGFLVLTRRRPVYPGRRAALALLGLGLMYGVQAAMFFSGLRRIPASVSSVLLYIYPAIVTLLAWRIYHSRPRKAEIGAIGLGLLGVLLTVRPWGLAGLEGAPGLDLVGAALVVGAAVSYSVYILLSAIMVKRTGPLVSTGWITAGAGMFFAVVGAATNTLTWHLPAYGGWLLLGMILFNTILPLVAFLAGLDRVGAAAASLISTLEPVFTVLLASAFLAERLEGIEIVGGVMVLSAAILVNLPGVRLERQTEDGQRPQARPPAV